MDSNLATMIAHIFLIFSGLPRMMICSVNMVVGLSTVMHGLLHQLVVVFNRIGAGLSSVHSRPLGTDVLVRLVTMPLGFTGMFVVLGLGMEECPRVRRWGIVSCLEIVHVGPVELDRSGGDEESSGGENSGDEGVAHDVKR